MNNKEKSIGSSQLILEVKTLSKNFEMKSFSVNALKDISFNVKSGEFIGLIGPSGSGKTTLINILSGLIRSSNGEVMIGDRIITSMESNELREFRLQNIGLVFQEHLLVESLTALENVELPLTFARIDAPTRKQKALELLERMDMVDKIHHFPSELSGGEQQRVGIARALVFDPLIILADEPTGDLDTKTGNSIIQIFKEITFSKTSSVIMVSHDPRHRLHFDRILELNDGSINSEP